jgi:hypothetical protein
LTDLSRVFGMLCNGTRIGLIKQIKADLVAALRLLHAKALRRKGFTDLSRDFWMLRDGTRRTRKARIIADLVAALHRFNRQERRDFFPFPLFH